MKPSQSLAGYIREHLPQLEQRFRFGYRHDAMVAELEKLGYKTTTKLFKHALYLERKKAEKIKLEQKKNPPIETIKEPNKEPEIPQSKPKIEPEKSKDPLKQKHVFAFDPKANIDHLLD